MALVGIVSVEVHENVRHIWCCNASILNLLKMIQKRSTEGTEGVECIKIVFHCHYHHSLPKAKRFMPLHTFSPVSCTVMLWRPTDARRNWVTCWRSHCHAEHCASLHSFAQQWGGMWAEYLETLSVELEGRKMSHLPRTVQESSGMKSYTSFGVGFI